MTIPKTYRTTKRMISTTTKTTKTMLLLLYFFHFFHLQQHITTTTTTTIKNHFNVVVVVSAFVGIHSRSTTTTSRRNDKNKKPKLKHNKKQTTMTHFRSSSSTNSIGRLYMAVSKTGGRLLQSTEEFNVLVLGETTTQSSSSNIIINNNNIASSPNSVSAELSSFSSPKPALVFWTAPWCGPCRLSIPVVKEIMKQFASKIDVYEVCTDDLPELAADAGVLSIPTIHLYYKGKQLDTIIGCVARSVLASAVEKSLEDIALKHGH